MSGDASMDAKGWIVHLEDEAAVDVVGNKFAMLSRVAARVPVPVALCVPVAALVDALAGQRWGAVRDFFADLQATSGAFLVSAVPALQAALADLAVSDALCAALQQELVRCVGPLDRAVFAVRSSAIDEDAAGASFAGVYRSSLGVRGMAQVCAAVVDCWRAYYDYPAILARVRAGRLSPAPGMAVIVQRMVQAELAGVAFTSGTTPYEVLVEYGYGVGDGLVAGVRSAMTFRLDDGHAHPPVAQVVLAEVVRMVSALRNAMGYDVDVEWAWAPDDLAIVQVRPVTARLDRAQAMGEPHFAWARLYFDEVLPLGMELGACRSIYASYVAKRAPAYRRAAATGVQVGAAFVVSFDSAGLLLHADTLKGVLAASSADSVVLDVSPALRQIIIKKADVLATLGRTFGLAHGSLQRHAVIIRDYIGGEFGFISVPLGDTGLLIECSRDGLLAINRGIAVCVQIVWDAAQQTLRCGVAQDDEGALVAQWAPLVPAIHAFTQELNQAIPGCQLEWVLEGGVPYFVDFSTEYAQQVQVQHPGGVVLAPGVASGPALFLDDDAGLTRLSIGPAISVGKTEDVVAHAPFQALIQQVAGRVPKPIVFVRRPYAALAVLLDQVAGFVFEQGSLLCHLAILLREARLPAVVAPHVRVAPNEQVVIDHEQVISVTSTVADATEER